MQFIISETDDVLVSHSGLALAGAMLQGTSLIDRLSAIEVAGSRRATMPHGEVLVSMIGLLCLGKSDYADIEAFRHEAFFAQSLSLRRLPSEETLRQRLDQLGTAPLAVLHEESADMIRRHAPPLMPCHRQYVPLDVDVSPFDNSGTKKEGVAYTYKQHEGYAPVLAYGLSSLRGCACAEMMRMRELHQGCSACGRGERSTQIGMRSIIQLSDYERHPIPPRAINSKLDFSSAPPASATSAS